MEIFVYAIIYSLLKKARKRIIAQRWIFFFLRKKALNFIKKQENLPDKLQMSGLEHPPSKQKNQ